MCAPYKTFKSSTDHKYLNMLVSLLLTNPPSSKTKEERGLPRGTQLERDQGNGLQLKLN